MLVNAIIFSICLICKTNIFVSNSTHWLSMHGSSVSSFLSVSFYNSMLYLCFCNRMNKVKWKISKQSNSNGTRAHKVSSVRVRTWERIVVWWHVRKYQRMKNYLSYWRRKGQSSLYLVLTKPLEGLEAQVLNRPLGWLPENLPTRTCHESYSFLNRKIGIQGHT